MIYSVNKKSDVSKKEDNKRSIESSSTIDYGKANKKQFANTKIDYKKNKNYKKTNSKPNIKIPKKNKDLIDSNKEKSKPLLLIEDNKKILDLQDEIKTSSSIVDKDFINEELGQRIPAVKNNNVGKYKIQIGAFGKISNANKFLEKIIKMNVDQTEFFIMEDYAAGLFKLKSIKSYNKDQGRSICKNFKDVNINCILSQI